MTDLSDPQHPRFVALREELRQLTSFIYVQTIDVHSWVSFLQKALKPVHYTTCEVAVASTPAATEEIEAIERKLAEYAKKKQTLDTAFFILAHARLTDQMIHTLKTILWARDVSQSKWIPVVIVINDEPFPDVSFPDFRVIKDEGPSFEEHKEYLQSIGFSLGPNADLPIDDLMDLFKGMSFAQIDRAVAGAIVMSRPTLAKGEPIPLEIFKLMAKDIQPAYPSAV